MRRWRRRSRVTPTGTGRAALARADKVGDRLVADVLRGLSAAEIGTVRELLTRGLARSAAAPSGARQSAAAPSPVSG